MNTTVIMASYNGEKYIEKQLESLYLQTCQPDEVIIRDDCSRDSTVEVVRKFIEKHELNNWTLKINKKNLGWKNNFFILMKEAKGDIIFICDQDDIWEQNRIEITKEMFKQNNDMLCMSVRYEAIGTDGLHLNVKHSRRSTGTNKLSLIDGFCHKSYSGVGCLLAYRKKLNKIIIKNEYKLCVGDNKIIPAYDTVINSYAFFLNGLYDFDKILIRHRFHTNNATVNGDVAKMEAGGQSVVERIEYLKCNSVIYRTIKDSIEEFGGSTDKISLAIEMNNKRLELWLENKWITMIRVMRLALKMRSRYFFRMVIGDIIYKCGLQNKFGKLYGVIHR